MTDRPLISVVAPAYNEEGGIREFHRRLSDTLQKIEPPVDYEIVVTENCSEDSTLEQLREIVSTDPKTRVIALSKNWGHQASITAGMDHAVGDAVVVIDADLQDPPEVIAQMVEKWREGFDVVQMTVRVAFQRGLAQESS